MIWPGKKSKFGYGLFGRKSQGAHRASWEFFFGAIPPDTCVCHKCDNPACFNPRHLFLGSHADNARDKVRKGRQSRTSNWGTKSKSNKLSPSDVIEARRLKGMGQTYASIGRHFGINITAARRAVLGITWKIVQ